MSKARPTSPLDTAFQQRPWRYTKSCEGRPPRVKGERRARQDAGSYIIDMDADMRDVALKVEGVLAGHAVIEWQSNDDVQRQMRRDVKGSLRATGRYDEGQLGRTRQPDSTSGQEQGVTWLNLAGSSSETRRSNTMSSGAGVARRPCR